MLVHTDVTRYLEFKVIAGSYVYRDGKISKVPSTEMEAVRSPLMGLFEKRRARNFFMFLQGWKEEDPATHQGECPHTIRVHEGIPRGLERYQARLKCIMGRLGRPTSTCYSRRGLSVAREPCKCVRRVVHRWELTMATASQLLYETMLLARSFRDF
jgi:hypothetical protein